jgi:pimeloyl-ACP methyl ester carboxylesterase
MTITPASLKTNGLTELESIRLAEAIRSTTVSTGLSQDASATTIATTYVQQGDGAPPILLLHGFDSSVMEFRRLLPRLAQHTQVWAVDLLGFGFTERPEGVSISPESIRTHLHRFWQTCIQQPVILVGASMGGGTAVDLTLTYPDLAQKLVLIDSAGYRSGPVLGRFLGDRLGYWATEGFLKKESVRQRISERAYRDVSFASIDAQRCAALHLDCPNWAKALISFTRSGGYPSFRQALPRIHCPTLVLWGDHDRILGTKDAPKIAALLPKGQLKWIPNCGHVPHLEQSASTTAAIHQFIGMGGE